MPCPAPLCLCLCPSDFPRIRASPPRGRRWEKSARAQTLAELNTARSLSGLTQEPNAETALQFMYNVGQKLQPTCSPTTTYCVVVGLNSDASVRRLKGPERPVRNEAERSYVLAALAMVDRVVVFEEDTPLELIRRLRPDVLVKGGDYTVETIVGATDVERWGGEVVVIPLTPGQSTTSIIEHLRGRSS